MSLQLSLTGPSRTVNIPVSNELVLFVPPGFSYAISIIGTVSGYTGPSAEANNNFIDQQNYTGFLPGARVCEGIYCFVNHGLGIAKVTFIAAERLGRFPLEDECQLRK